MMFHYTGRTFLCVLLITVHLICPVYNSSYFNFKTSHRSLDHVENSIESFTSNIEMQCARRCLRNPLCSTIAVRTSDNVCKMLTRTAQGSPHVGGPNWIKYEIGHDDCSTSDSQMYVRELNACYWHHPKGFYSVHESIDRCAENGGHLVRIDSNMKQFIVEDLMGNDVQRAYIQGNNTQDDGVWRFDDGSTMTYLNWYISMPRKNKKYSFIIIRRSFDFKWQNQEPEPANFGISVMCEKTLK